MTQISLNTHYFQLLADADIAGRHSVLLAVIARNDSGTLRVIARDFSQKVMPAVSSTDNTEKDTKDAEIDSMTEAARKLL